MIVRITTLKHSGGQGLDDVEHTVDLEWFSRSNFRFGLSELSLVARVQFSICRSVAYFKKLDSD